MDRANMRSTSRKPPPVGLVVAPASRRASLGFVWLDGAGVFLIIEDGVLQLPNGDHVMIAKDLPPYG